MTSSFDCPPEIIRLQLRKPKSWQWQLSTSKSSPHITLPIIQLYDYKGHLLVEARDEDEGGESFSSLMPLTRNWGAHGNNRSSRNRESLPPNRNLKRCSSDTLGQQHYRQGGGDALSPSSGSGRSILQTPNNGLGRTASRRNKGEEERLRTELKKSKSDFEVVKDTLVTVESKRDPAVRRSTSTRKTTTNLKDGSSGGCDARKSDGLNKVTPIPSPRCHRRSRSDDMFRRKLRYSSEESVKRAEIDGYRNFINPNIPIGPSEPPQATSSSTMESKQVTHLKHKRYKTRTCSAGTLIVTDESFRGNGAIATAQRRRRSRRSQNQIPEDDSWKPTTSAASIVPGVREGSTNDANPLPVRVDRSISSRSLCPQRHTNNKLGGNGDGLHHSMSDVLPLSRLQSHHHQHIVADADNSRRQRKPFDSNASRGRRRNYCSPEAAKAEGDGERKSSRGSARRSGSARNDEEIAEKLNGKRCRKTKNSRASNQRRRRRSNESTSSEGRSQVLRRCGKKSGHLIRDHSVPPPSRESSSAASTNGASNNNNNTSKEGSELLRLVRCLSSASTAPSQWRHHHQQQQQHHHRPQAPSRQQEDADVGDDVLQMGANVSRHSAKGLSGRRSRSSGSICSGKGAGGGGGGGSCSGGSGKGGQCSSLPNYLDDDGSGKSNGGCSNNNRHDCDKQGLDEVDRIPPLGDGAPLHWKFSDSSGSGGGVGVGHHTASLLCDQGYGSERSPEEEYPPPLPDHHLHHLQCHHHLEPHHCYPFVTPESTFTVKLTKGSRGLGLSVTGGVDSTSGSWPGLVRIKRLFPHQPASACGLLSVGDLLLEVNGEPLTGLTNYEALEVLRTTSNQVELKVCRPPPDVLNCVSPISEVPPPPPRREPPNSLNLPSSTTIYSTPEDDYYHGEFEITLQKIQGSLGFTLRKEDDSALGHYVRALVREPALTDGRIKAGDKIIAVNDVEICPMTHEQAVQFLRQCPEIVKLRLYRDSAQTPVATLSPSETTPRTSFSRKAHLRQEAVDMLNDIAGRKLSGISHDMYVRSMSSPSSSPRRLRRTPCPSDTSHSLEPEEFHEGLLQQCPHPFDDDTFHSLFSNESDDGDKPSRPSSLDLYNPNQTPVAARKPRFNFSLAHNAYELNNLDPEVLDAPNLTYNLGNEENKTTEPEAHEPASMPHIPTNNPTFSYKNPAYQSAHPQISSDVIEPVQPVVVNQQPAIQKEDSTKKKKNNSQGVQRNVREHPMKEEYEVLAIELNRGWNSRLGFSLQGAAGVTYVSAVHADSVAAKDGRLKPGDRLIKVNDESIEHMSTSEIIDLLRIVRGPVCIVVSRVKSNEDCLKSNAEN